MIHGMKACREWKIWQISIKLNKEVMREKLAVLLGHKEHGHWGNLAVLIFLCLFITTCVWHSPANRYVIFISDHACGVASNRPYRKGAITRVNCRLNLTLDLYRIWKFLNNRRATYLFLLGCGTCYFLEMFGMSARREKLQEFIENRKSYGQDVFICLTFIVNKIYFVKWF
jgi:hypothetical protein